MISFEPTMDNCSLQIFQEAGSGKIPIGFMFTKRKSDETFREYVSISAKLGLDELDAIAQRFREFTGAEQKKTVEITVANKIEGGVKM